MTVNSTKVNNLKTSLDNAYASKSHTHSGYESSSNKVTSLSSSSTDAQYPSAKSVYNALQNVEANSGGNYIDDYYFDTTSKEIVLDFTSGSSGGGSGGSVDIVTSWESTLSDEKVPSEKLVKETINGLNVPLASVSAPLVDVTGGAIGSSTSYAKADHQHPLSTSYASSNHDHDSDYLAKASTDTGFVKSNGNIVAFGTTSGTVSEGNHTHSGYLSATKVTSWSSTVSDSNVPSEKLVKNYIDEQIGTAIQYIQQ